MHDFLRCNGVALMVELHLKLIASPSIPDRGGDWILPTTVRISKLAIAYEPTWNAGLIKRSD